jgi:hypothetical protein
MTWQENWISHMTTLYFPRNIINEGMRLARYETRMYVDTNCMEMRSSWDSACSSGTEEVHSVM